MESPHHTPDVAKKYSEFSAIDMNEFAKHKVLAGYQIQRLHCRVEAQILKHQIT